MNEYEQDIDGPDLRSSVDRSKIEDAIRLIIEAIGEDPNRPGLKRTPERVADMYADLFSGVGKDAREALSVVFEEGHDELVMVRDIPFYSLCEHHLVPFHGAAHVGYLPNDRGEITGLSKLARVVEVVARRPQVQERLTSEIADVIMEVLDAKGSIVIIEAEHLCMSMRGIRKPGAVTVTSAVRGIFKSNSATRAEAMSLLRHTSG